MFSCIHLASVAVTTTAAAAETKTAAAAVTIITAAAVTTTAAATTRTTTTTTTTTHPGSPCVFLVADHRPFKDDGEHAVHRRQDPTPVHQRPAAEVLEEGGGGGDADTGALKKMHNKTCIFMQNIPLFCRNSSAARHLYFIVCFVD